jgi:hypothetical protein
VTSARWNCSRPTTLPRRIICQWAEYSYPRIQLWGDGVTIRRIGPVVAHAELNITSGNKGRGHLAGNQRDAV